VKNKLATLQDRLDNALKDDHTALKQLEKTLPLSEVAKKKYDKLSNRKLRQ
jgi:ferritin-like metal-binding protein YciE